MSNIDLGQVIRALDGTIREIRDKVQLVKDETSKNQEKYVNFLEQGEKKVEVVVADSDSLKKNITKFITDKPASLKEGIVAERIQKEAEETKAAKAETKVPSQP